MENFRSDNYLINRDVGKLLDKIVNTKTFSNGYIFHGAEGVGKKETALKFIR